MNFTKKTNNMNIKIVGSEAVTGSGLSKEALYQSCIMKKSSVNLNNEHSGLASISVNDWSLMRDDVKMSHNESQCLVISAYTLKKVLQQVQWSEEELSECGFIFATTTSQIDQWQKSLPFCYFKNLSFEEITQATKYQSLGLTLIELQNLFGIHGPSTMVASSCSASLQAINLASLWIKSGIVKRCLVGSTEILSDLTINGFNSLRLLSKEICKPFDSQRTGINLGEASAFICLEKEGLTGREAQAYIQGVGFSTDAYHPTAPLPEGTGSVKAINMSLQTACLKPENIDWIYAHGTGSVANDLAESNAIQSVFSSASNNYVVSSTKSIHGHTLGACGAVESVIAFQSLINNKILTTFNTETIDARIINKIAYNSESSEINKTNIREINYILKNTLGFGGINASSIFSKYRY